MWFSTPWRVEAWAVLSSCLLLGHAAWANTTPPDAALPAATSARPAPPQLPGSRLQGQATLRYFGLRVYHAKLWTRSDFQVLQAVDQPLVLELEYLRDLKGQAIAERSLQEMQRAAPIANDQAQRWLRTMQRLFPDVKAGDRISGERVPGQGLRFWFNGQLQGQVDDPEFARVFLGIWLAPSSSEPGMRLALLGLDPKRTAP